ncbi:restriction endonuclease subunit S [Campylobacter upsaliensis]|uniref:restriction endonuclease subunit S n=1 Tax=Campylobacter upsaliensis TaxID=28080 RepID=UPI002149B5AE|nr:restriction endonuclease subunit S [Campylobacter upsaliensis]MCR2103841.1 restriction endonuclease subunit S [Campylobacter upsaliensis]
MKTLNDNTHPLESLLQQHCPNGVEFKELGELWEKAPKSKMGANQAKNLSKNNGNICFTSGETHYFIDDYLVDGEFLFLNDGGTADIKYNSGKAYYTDHIFAFTSQKICVKFLYYFLKDKQEAINKTCFQGTGLKNLQKNKIEKFPIPLPPLEIQYKIVEILDAFTELEAELEAELKARLKQYEYYRNFLLSFEELYRRTDMLNGGSLELVSLGELFTIKNGYTPSKTKAEFWECGTIPWFRMEDIQKNGRILKDSIQHITPQAVKGGKLFPANSIIIATTATIGEHALVIVDYLSNQQFTCLIPQINCCDKLSMRFMFYYGFILGEWCRNNVNKSAFPSVKMDKFKKFQIPLPPLEVQNEIVEILDKFDTLTNDLTSGIPAEIEARKKQYEYYRERLLSFIVKD